MNITVERYCIRSHAYLTRFIAILISLCLVVIPIIYNSKVHAVIGSATVISLILAVLIACGITFTVSNSDIVPNLQQLLTEFYTYEGFLSDEDWLGSSWLSDMNIDGNYLSMTPSIWQKVMTFLDWAQGNLKLPSGGNVSSPQVQDLISPCKLSFSVGQDSFVDYPVFPYSMISSLTSIYSYDYWKIYKLPANYTLPYTIDPYTYYSGTFSLTTNGATFTKNLIIPGTYTLSGNTELSSILLYGSNKSFSNIVPVTYTSGQYINYSADLSKPIYLCFVQQDSNSMAGVSFYYTGLNGLPMVCVAKNYNSTYQMIVPIQVSSGSLTASSTGMPDYIFDNTDRIYIDLQQGNLSSVLSALQNLITQVNQNLIVATIAIQEANASNLPVDTTPFIQLVESYENVTNNCISGQTTVSSALSSMYTLLSSSISNITNPSLENACINAYNAFLNKLSLFQSSGSSTTNYTYSTVQTLQSTLDTYYHSFSGGAITYDQMLSTAAGALSTSVSSATSTQEIISLNNVYQSFLQRVGATLDGSTYSQDVIDGFNDTLDDYTDGTISRSQALSSLKSDYRIGIAGTSSAVDVAAITAAYQAAVDQIATSEFTLSSAAGQVSAEAMELEDSIIDEFDYVSLSAMLDFQNWQFFPDQEANLYREYFQRFFSESDSPFYAFLYYPLVLGIAGLILGTGIRFAVRARKSRGSSNSQGGDT